MKHIKPISKAALDWSTGGPLAMIQQILAVLQVLLPFIQPLLDSKNGEGEAQ
ncbi:MAG: hypothetical protein GWP08_04875 [Nitrospiraceae bacterium]|nr:hypothetical protein [Nitrospiraceae bacterium]